MTPKIQDFRNTCSLVSPDWQYNLFCMIHGRDRGAVARQVEALARELDIAKVPREVLFSGRRFKQRGADYQPTAMG